jgi:predicted transcriptional regulator
MSTAEREIDVLETIQRSTDPVRQREIAHAIGLSLGMTNEILKRLAKKGWLSIRKVNSRNIQYVVSSKGVEEIAGRSYRYLRRTIGNIVRYKEAIEQLVREVKDSGWDRMALVGKSDLDFIVENSCRAMGVHLLAASGETREAPDGLGGPELARSLCTGGDSVGKRSPAFRLFAETVRASSLPIGDRPSARGAHDAASMYVRTGWAWLGELLERVPTGERPGYTL